MLRVTTHSCTVLEKVNMPIWTFKSDGMRVSGRWLPMLRCSVWNMRFARFLDLNSGCQLLATSVTQTELVRQTSSSPKHADLTERYNIIDAMSITSEEKNACTESHLPSTDRDNMRFPFLQKFDIFACQEINRSTFKTQGKYLFQVVTCR